MTPPYRSHDLPEMGECRSDTFFQETSTANSSPERESGDLIRAGELYGGFDRKPVQENIRVQSHEPSSARASVCTLESANAIDRRGYGKCGLDEPHGNMGASALKDSGDLFERSIFLRIDQEQFNERI